MQTATEERGSAWLADHDDGLCEHAAHAEGHDVFRD